jgi:hypothetical protein
MAGIGWHRGLLLQHGSQFSAPGAAIDALVELRRNRSRPPSLSQHLGLAARGARGKAHLSSCWVFAAMPLVSRSRRGSYVTPRSAGRSDQGTEQAADVVAGVLHLW